MAVLLAGIPLRTSVAIATRLLEHGDEIRAIADYADEIEELRRIGVKVAPGESSDADLVERAATGTRTVVVSESEQAALENLDADVRRIVICARAPGTPKAENTVYLVVGKPRWGRARVPTWLVAAAVDAADDLADASGMVIDLTRPEGPAALGL
jgi:hypothetical protein